LSSRLSRAAKDRWAAKRWFTVYASSAFGFAELGTIPANDERSVLGRVLEVSFYDITKDISQLPIKLKFQIVRVDGDKAYTQFKGFELSGDYVRSLVRRGTTRVDAIVDLTTTDGVHMRVFALVVTAHRVKASQERAIRRIATEVLLEKASKLTFDEYVQESVLGIMAQEIFVRAKKIYPLKKVEIRKIKVLTPTAEIPLKLPEETAEAKAA